MSCFCTLFNSKYLDRGMALIESLESVSPDSYIYVFAFDDICYDVLKNENYANVRLVSLKEFETDELLAIKASRSSKAYCWTCTPFIIKHVLEFYKENECTYIDADMLFYSDPEVLLNEMRGNKCDVGIVEHRFGKGKVQEQQITIAGKYCVEFNSFINNSNGIEVLNYWAMKCAECCTDDVSQSSEGKFGDQMYLNDWTSRFTNVHVLENHGGGMAPWNVYRYRQMHTDADEIHFKDIQSDGEYSLVFYHFHGMKIYQNGTVDIAVFGRYGNPDVKLLDSIYIPYLNLLKAKRELLYNKYKLEMPVEENVKNNLSDMIHLRSFVKRLKDRRYHI